MEKDKKIIKIFLDTNIIISGTFFKGNESRLLSLIDLEFYISDLVVEEAQTVIRRKFKVLGTESVYVALCELENTLKDFKIISIKNYSQYIEKAREIIPKEKDSKILAAIMAIKPDYFVTGDSDFFTEKVSNVVKVYSTKELLREIGIRV